MHRTRMANRGCPIILISLKMPLTSPPLLLSYWIHEKRRITPAPIAVAAAHFAVTYVLMLWWHDRLPVLVFAALHRHPGDPVPSLSFPDYILRQVLFRILLVPIRGIWLKRIGHVAISPFFFIAMNSVLWGMACWFLILLHRHVRAGRRIG